MRAKACVCVHNSVKLMSSAAAIALCVVTTVSAQTGGLDTITVTAERKVSTVQETPIAISAIGGDALRANNKSNLEALSGQIPNFTFSRNSGDGKVFIRGIGYNSISPGGETRVGIYLDGAYQSRNQVSLNAFYDVERIEVLRGPQGTLYGRNTIGGAVNILTRAPGDELNGYLTGTIGNYGLFSGEGAIGGPLSDSVSGRLAFRVVKRNGYGINLLTGEDVRDENSQNVRANLQYDLSDSFTVRVIGDYARIDDASSGYNGVGGADPNTPLLGELLGGFTNTNPQDFVGAGLKTDMETYGVSLQADWSLSDSTSLTFISTFRDFYHFHQDTLDGYSLILTDHYITEDATVFTEELRLSHSFGDFADLILGGYYFHENNSALNEAPWSGASLTGPYAPPFFNFGQDPDTLYEFFAAFGEVETRAWAVFAQASIYLTDQLQLDIGGRYNSEKKTLDEEFQLPPAEINLTTPFVRGRPFLFALTSEGEQDEDSFDPKVTLSYKATDDVLAYATYSQGFKAGGFNIGGLQEAFEPEKLKNYEIGVKAELLDGRMRANLAGFRYDYTELQVSLVEGTSLVTRNAASATVWGAEAELTFLPVENLRIDLNAGYLDASFEDFSRIDPTFPALGEQDLSGNVLPHAPEYQINGVVQYTIPTEFGDFTPSVSVLWVDDIYFTEFNVPELFQEARTQVDAYLNWELPDSGWSAVFFVKNATDDVYLSETQTANALTGSTTIGQYGAPRTFGFSLTKEF